MLSIPPVSYFVHPPLSPFQISARSTCDNKKWIVVSSYKNELDITKPDSNTGQSTSTDLVGGSVLFILAWSSNRGTGKIKNGMKRGNWFMNVFISRFIIIYSFVIVFLFIYLGQKADCNTSQCGQKNRHWTERQKPDYFIAKILCIFLCYVPLYVQNWFPFGKKCWDRTCDWRIIFFDFKQIYANFLYVLFWPISWSLDLY
jgi:hypothetical protein